MSNRALTFTILASLSLLLAVFAGHLAIKCHLFALGQFEHRLEIEAPETSVMVTLPAGHHEVHVAPPGGLCSTESWEVPSIRVDVIRHSGEGFERAQQTGRCPFWSGRLSTPSSGDLELVVRADTNVQLVVSTEYYLGVLAGLRWHATIATAILATPMVVLVWYFRRKRRVVI